MKTADQLEPTVLAIFGGAGDVTWRKRVPALFDLSQDRSLPAQFAIIAVERIQLGDTGRASPHPRPMRMRRCSGTS
jgi:glucose-6-phosphate 1-dehydrogenase